MDNVKSAGFVLFRKSHKGPLFLILHYESGHWDFPKGNIEKSETDMQAALRELKEETGITDVKIIEGHEERIKYSYSYKGKLIRKEVVFFLAETCQKEVNLSYEHTDFEWMDLKSAIQKVTYENAKNLLRKADEIMKQKGIRE